ncbi:ABC transporter permease [Luteimicrobium album]|uniref:ABC transporter permease n=1 Tax=Luteimicrobium album TaxID=1054550 RepID=A0ABQ6I0T2_9MICO|nr:sugar ABC transporter permease [Luteimicrobium album]GMA24052.1 ABC transporter permease [Luteimicrobium album]
MAALEETVAAPRVAPSRRGRRRGSHDTLSRHGWRITPWLFLLVPVAFLVTFTYVPVFNMFGYSFTSWDGLDAKMPFVGLDNYVKLFTEPSLFRVFVVSLFYLVGSVVQLVLALYFATILSFKTRLRNLFKGIIFFPYLINGVAISLIFLFFFRPGGTLDSVLGLVGIHDTPQWLGNPDIANWSLAGTSVWRYLGLNFVLFLGAIQSVPAELYEAADLDGATSWHKFRYIIAPSIRQILVLTMILSVSGSLSAFEIPYIMTGGANGTMTFVIQTLNTAFNFRQVGLASAMAVVLLLIVLLVAAIQRTVFPEQKKEDRA